MSLLSSVLSLFQRPPRRPLADRRPGREEMGQVEQEVPLGMEAIDMDHVERSARINDALERTNSADHVLNKRGSRRIATFVAPMPEDETYAERYHRMYKKKAEPDE